MSLLTTALIDIDYYETMSGEDTTDITDRIENLINITTISFEKFCNRLLKARDFDYLSTSSDYNQLYTIFDGIEGKQFYFPTYPVNTLTTLVISDLTITAATDYDDLDGYHLYNSRGMLIYHGGFDFGYNKNVKIKWNGGYTANHEDMEELKYLCFDMVRTMNQNIENAMNTTLKSEKIGNYAYTNFEPGTMYKMQGLNPNVFAALKKYRKEVF
jgi:hypothetical protein